MIFYYNTYILLIIVILIVTNLGKIHSRTISIFKKAVIANNNTKPSLMATTTIKIVKKCFTDDLDKIIFAGDWIDFASWSDLFLHISINTIGSSQSKVFERHKRLSGFYEISEVVVKSLRYPAKVFIVSTSHQPLNETFMMMRNSIFWNSEATVFLIDEDPKNLCLNASYSLQVAWEFNILHAFYLCHNVNAEIYFYNFNPFMDFASKSWEKAEVLIDKKRNHPIIIYRLSFNMTKEASLCQTLSFDKTHVLDGYPIKLCGFIDPVHLNEETVSKPLEPRNISDFTGVDSSIARMIWDKLQTSPTIRTFLDSGYIENNAPHGMVKSIIKDDYDMIVNEFYYRSFWRLETYPHGISGMCALTRKRQRTSNIATMLWMFKPRMISLVVPLSLLAALMLKYLLKIRFVDACLRVLGMLLGVSTKYPISAISRINVAYLIILMFGLNIYLESSLTSFLVAPDIVYNIDSMQDIINYKYKVSGRPFVKEFLVEDNFTNVYSESYFDECMDKIRMGHRVACIRDCLSAIYYNKHDYIHLSKQSLKDIHMTFLFREDWPLRVRLNALVQRIREAGIIKFVRDIEVFKFNSQRSIYQKREGYNGVSFHEAPLNLKVMSFVWYILGVGVLLSCGAFIFELYVRKNQ